MPNANCTPLGPIRRRPVHENDNNGLSHSSTSIPSIPEEKMNIIKEETQVNSQYTSGACSNCGMYGHLTWQCKQKKIKGLNNVLISSSFKEENNVLSKTNGKSSDNLSRDSCLSLESQKLENWQERIHRLETESDEMNISIDSINKKCDKSSYQLTSFKNSYTKEFVKTKELANQEVIQQMQEKINLLTDKANDQKIIYEQNLNFQQMCISLINENKIHKNSEDEKQNLNNNEELIKENKLLKEANEKMLKNEQDLTKKIQLLNFEKSILNKCREEKNEKLLELNNFKENYQKLEKELGGLQVIISQLKFEKAQIKSNYEQEIEKLQKEATFQKSEKERITDLYNKLNIKNKAINIQNNNLASKNRKLNNDLSIIDKRTKDLQNEINKIHNQQNLTKKQQNDDGNIVNNSAIMNNTATEQSKNILLVK